MAATKSKLVSCLGYALRVSKTLDVPREVQGLLQVALHSLLDVQCEPKMLERTMPVPEKIVKGPISISAALSGSHDGQPGVDVKHLIGRYAAPEAPDELEVIEAQGPDCAELTLSGRRTCLSGSIGDRVLIPVMRSVMGVVFPLPPARSQVSNLVGQEIVASGKSWVIPKSSFYSSYGRNNVQS